MSVCCKHAFKMLVLESRSILHAHSFKDDKLPTKGEDNHVIRKSHTLNHQKRVKNKPNTKASKLVAYIIAEQQISTSKNVCSQPIDLAPIFLSPTKHVVVALVM